MVAERKKRVVNLCVSQEISDAFDEVSEAVGGKQKWAVATAAILLLLNQPEELRKSLFQYVIGVEATDSLDAMIEQAKDGKLIASLRRNS